MKKISVLVLFVITHLVTAQSSNFVFDHLNVEDGLSNNGVSCIYQDKKGLMWIGTFNGLNMYNGYEFKTYYNDPFNPGSISDTRITCIYEDSKSNLWIGTHQGGLNLYNRNKDNFSHYLSGLQGAKAISSNTIECIVEDSKGNIWVGTNYGLNLIDPSTSKVTSYFNQPDHPNSINSNQIYSIIERDECLWVLTNKEKLNKFDYKTGNFSEITIPGLAPSLLKSARILFQDAKKNLWIGTLDDGLIEIRGSEVIHYKKTSDGKGLSHNLIKDIVQDKEGNIWVGTDGGGINLIDPSKKNIQHIWYNPQNKNGLNGNAVYSLFVDKSGTLWAGTFTGGLNIHSRQKGSFTHYNNIPNNSNSLSENSVLSILPDKNGMIWVGTDGGGLNLLDPATKKFTHFKNNPANASSLSSNVVKCLYEDKSGNLWVGTFLGGLNLFDRRTNKFYKYTYDSKSPNSISGNIVWAIYEDSRDNLWISTLGNGLCILDRKTNQFRHFQPFSEPSGLGDYNVISMLEDSQGNLWIGTEDNGLNLYNYQTNTFSYFKHDPKNSHSISSNHAFVLFEDSSNNLWVGTAGGGLNLLNRKDKTFKSYTEKDGLPSNIICGITEDKLGNLWISTGKGLSKFNIKNKSFKNFNKDDGLSGNEFNINSGCKTMSGDLYFGGLNGFTKFNPSDIKVNLYIPPVLLTDFRIFNQSIKPGSAQSPLIKPISETKEITLSYKDAVISFEFAALNYLSSAKNQYAYKLEGFDKQWNYSGTKREATYTNLDPGEYIFRVKGSNNDGYWNETPTSVKVIIIPPWWKTTWFRIMAFILIVGSAFTAYKVRTYKIRKTMRLERLRELQMKEAEIREEKLKYENALMEMTKVKLESEINFKNSKLASSVMNIVKQNETLLAIKENIEVTLKEKDESLQKKNLKKIVKTIDQEVKPEQNWNEFEHLFNQIHQNFLQRLKEQFPELTNRDLKLCAYLRMNLNSKEIAPLIGVSVRGVEDMRYRIRKKMGLDTSVNLAEFIISL